MSNVTKRNGTIVVKGANGKIKNNISTKGKTPPTAAKPKPALGKIVDIVNGRVKYVKEVQDKPSYIRTGKNPYENAVLGSPTYILKEFLDATEEQALKVFKADLGVDSQKYADGETKFNRVADEVYSLLYKGNHHVKIQQKIDSLHPEFWDYFNDRAWESLATYAYHVSMALKARGKIPQNKYDILTTTWRKYVGPIHPDDEDIFVKNSR